MNLNIGYDLPKDKHAQFRIYVSMLKHFGLKDYSFMEYARSGLDIQSFFWSYDENQNLIKEYTLFREWFKYPQKYNEDENIKALIDKYGIFDNCDLKEKAPHLRTYLRYFDCKGFEEWHKERIKANIDWFF